MEEVGKEVDDENNINSSPPYILSDIGDLGKTALFSMKCSGERKV